jgi:DNA segregation ATPase FtsK/SpoIIIE, S-DNA-T family
VARRSNTQETSSKAKRKTPPKAKATTRVARGSSVLSRDEGALSRVLTSIKSRRARRGDLRSEIALVLVIGLGALLLFALLSHHPLDTRVDAWGVLEADRPVRNWVGPIGAGLSDVVVGLLGMTAFTLPILLVLGAIGLLGRRVRRPKLGEGVGLVGLVLTSAMLVQLVFPDVAFRGAIVAGGGWAGELLASLLVSWISVPGTWVVGLTLLVVCARLTFGLRVFQMGRAVGHGGGAVARRGFGGVRAGLAKVAGWIGGLGGLTRDRLDDWRHERELRREERAWERDEQRARLEEERLARLDAEDEARAAEDEARAAQDEARAAEDEAIAAEAGPAVTEGDVGADSTLSPPEPERRASRVRRPKVPVQASQPRSASVIEPSPPAVQFEESGATPSEPEDIQALQSLRETGSAPAAVASVQVVTPEEQAPRVDSMRGAAARGVVHARIDIGGGPRPSRGPAVQESGRTSPPSVISEAPLPESSPRIHGVVAMDPEAERVDRVVSARRFLRRRDEPFELPQLGLLDLPGGERHEVDEQDLERQAARLEETLGHYGVEGRVTDILPGPVVTMFEFEPAPGIKVSRIAGLGDDLAMALRALKVRIVAPIPGKGAVGIEVPSAHRQTVNFREVLASKVFRSGKMQLPLALGKGIDGTPVSSDMAKMPHILVAGTTGSGKSVCVNTVILSLLYSRTPEQVRLILVDPKMLEFSVYDGIPHLLVPVVTSPKKAAVALRWAVEEMQRRYRVLSAIGARNIVNYNEKAERLIEQWDQWDKDSKAGRKGDPPDCGRAAGEDTVCHRSEGGMPLGPPEKMPHIVIIIDELSDLMMVARKEVEESIVRLAQMARAAGIHMLLATQRPSVDVITGLIKANFPTRLSFRVSSKVDSRTVLDANGAENLLGLGDGLFLAPGVSEVKRVHGAFVTDDEVARVVEHLKTQGEPVYVDAVLANPEGDGEGEDEDGEADPMYDQCVAVVAEAGKASTSLLQRRLKLGYNRAARIMDTMEQRGVIGPQDGARPREVYVKPYEF